MQVVQVDHTKADIFVVDEETRQPIGRPWLTLAMDVCSRMVTGFYLTMDAPSRLSTSLCLLHSVFDKSAWLREREITEAWPVAGLPETLHVDNGADFRSRAFKRGCQVCRHRDRMATTGRAPLRWPYRTSDRHPDGEAPPAAWHDVQQRAGAWRIRFQAAFGPHFARTRALHRPRYCRLLPSVDPQQFGPPANCRLAGARRRDSAATAARSDAFLAGIPARTGAHLAAKWNSSVWAALLVACA
nr:transposase family protein [Sinorhizobium medicae]